MPFVTALDVEVHYVQHGPDDALRTAVFLHGFSLDHRECLGTFEPVFADRPGWRRLYLDSPGMGRTKAPEWVSGTDDVFRITAAALDALIDGPYCLGGISYGGYIAAGLTAAAPERVQGLALVVPMMMGFHGRQVATHQLLWREQGLVVPAESEEHAVVLTRESVRRSREQIDVPNAEIDEAAVTRIAERYDGTFPLLSAGGPYDRPALVVVGRQDSVLGFNDQWRAYGQWPRTTFVVLDRGGHGLFVEQPALVETLLRDWLDRIEQRAPAQP